MMNRDPKPPAELMQAITSDLRPVKPSPLPHWMALRTAPLALVISSLILLAIGVRHDSGILGPLVTWGASCAQFALAIVLVWIAARESTPSRRLPIAMVYSAAAIAVLAVVGITLSTFSVTPLGGTPRIPPWIAGLACGVGSTIAGGVLILLFSWVFRKSLTTRPAVAGALYGAGAGIAINAGWRIACPAPTLGHTLGAHGTAIIATTLLGAFIAPYFATGAATREK